MNRKNINFIFNKIPLSSSIIGSPRHTMNLKDYIQTFPQNGTIQYFSDLKFDKENPSLPEFFNLHDFENYHSYFIAQLKNGRVWGTNGSVIAEGDYFIKDVSREFNKGMNIEHSVFYTLKQKKAKNLLGNVAVLGTAGANVYYHWMLDFLPRLALISRRIALEKIDHFVTEFTNLPFQLETLEKVRIPVDKIIPSNDNWAFHVKASNLWLPSLAGPLGQPTPFQVTYLQSLYKNEISKTLPFRKLYISRKKTARRFIVNEDELINRLLKFDFQIIETDQITVAEQVKLFSESLIVISSHGSALTNLVFCHRGTTVIDIFNNSHTNICFWQISQLNFLNYHIFSGESVAIDNNPKNDNTILNIDKFEKLLEGISL